MVYPKHDTDLKQSSFTFFFLSSKSTTTALHTESKGYAVLLLSPDKRENENSTVIEKL